MRLTLIEADGLRAVEGPPDQEVMTTADDVRGVLEVCFSHRTRAVMLHAANLPAGFFDLSSGDAGTILQKLRNYGVRLAVVCADGAARFSSRFGEMVAEERQHQHFAVFRTREEARAWLSLPRAAE